VTNVPRALVSANEMHLRRVRRMLVHGSVTAAGMGLAWGIYFALHENWLIVSLDVCAIALSALDIRLVRRGALRQASHLFVAVLFALLVITALMIDIPTARVPRTMHLFLLPLTACACLLARDEPPALRHGIPAACLAAFILLAGTNWHVANAFALSDAVRSVGMWIDILFAMITLYGAVLVILAEVAERNGIELELRNALIRGELLLNYQPQVGEDGRVIGAEALIRWRHPVRGLVPPNDFIPLAESTGLMIPIGDWVLRSACVQLARWQSNPASANVTLAVNVSASQFAEAGFVQRVLDIVRETGVPISLLKLELTESMLADDIEAVVRKMAELKSHGVRLSLDDFGTGFSSLNYLRQLPLDQLKIDQSFVRNILRSSEDASIARTVVALGRTLGLDVIAEGVETVEHRRTLAEMGCTSYQGYYFARPMAGADFDAFVNEAAAAAHVRTVAEADDEPVPSCA
jgi:EAL domain-containing protein (putative c-di-GMP-specific phosphodiesterase class I)